MHSSSDETHTTVLSIDRILENGAIHRPVWVYANVHIPPGKLCLIAAIVKQCRIGEWVDLFSYCLQFPIHIPVSVRACTYSCVASLTVIKSDVFCWSTLNCYST